MLFGEGLQLVFAVHGVQKSFNICFIY
jgi:hypothetical protein